MKTTQTTMTRTDDEDNYEECLKIVAADLGITDMPDIDVIHVSWTGEQLWMKARIIARSMNIMRLKGKEEGLEVGKKIMEDTYGGSKPVE